LDRKWGKRLFFQTAKDKRAGGKVHPSADQPVTDLGVNKKKIGGVGLNRRERHTNISKSADKEFSIEEGESRKNKK